MGQGQSHAGSEDALTGPSPRLAWALLAALCLGPLAPVARVHAVDGGAGAKAEIEYLLQYLEASDCEFYRNGSWYGPRKAAAHLRRKYGYYLDHAGTPSAQEFIDTMASASSLSGQPYQVRCPGAGPVAAGAWFEAELSRHRALQPAR